MDLCNMNPFLLYPEYALSIAVSKIKTAKSKLLIRYAHHRHSRAIDRLKRSLKILEFADETSKRPPSLLKRWGLELRLIDCDSSADLHEAIASTKAALLSQKEYFESKCKPLVIELESVRKHIEVLKTRANPELLADEIQQLTLVQSKIRSDLSWYEAMLAKLPKKGP